MGTLHELPQRKRRDDGSVSAAWEAYRILAQAWRDNPSLRVDFDHCVEMTRALARFQKLFMESESA